MTALADSDVRSDGVAARPPEAATATRQSVSEKRGRAPGRGGRAPPPACPQPSTASRRLEARGFEGIPDAELLAQLLALFIGDSDADHHAHRLLHQFGSLADVVTAPPHRLQEVSDLQGEGLLTLRLLWELAARLAWQEVVQQPVLGASANVMAYCRVRLARERVDQVRVLYLDLASRLIADELLQTGTVGHVELFPRKVFVRALALDASKIIIARGCVGRPASLLARERSDVKALETAGVALGIRLVDYLVIGRDSHVSYRVEERSGRQSGDG